MNFLQTKINEMKKRKEEGNKGFSLVELIIVIAIMAILVGIVGTQVIPYINKSKESKDQQVVNSYSTAGVTAYSENAEKITANITVFVYGEVTGTTNVGGESDFATAVKNKTYSTIDEAKKKFKSNHAKDVADIKLEVDITNHKITATAVNASGTKVTGIEPVEGDL
ncbi:MAG: type II secretion system GspH family protein [Lachnospiraceae bacterium]|jgi:type IV pilus assembly protein PilA|uniref:type II secretion system protein n=1 Tax=Clostridium sp. AF34-13 TaxID=2293012 RepID=UPI001FAB2406|nr:type II secretion system protein [Clostridium sp. AF34-13]UYJ41424.1 MAG: type II secretion system GspH family protein [Lachnospiraceae bacterium]